MAVEDGDPTESGSRRTVSVARHDAGVRYGRIALIAAALVAAVAVGISLWNGRANGPVTAVTPSQVQGQPDVATMIAQLENRMKESPGDAEGWRMLGWSYYRTERFADAAGAYRRAVGLDPKNAEGWSALGEAIALAAPPPGSIPPEAEAAFREAVALEPANPRARYFLAVKKDIAGDHKGAIDDWLTLLAETPPGAPWEQNVRETITQVASEHGIDIAGRLPAPSATPSVAADAIPGPTREQMAAASSLPPAQQDEMVRGMVDSLAAKLKANPNNADGWIRLMRAHMVLGDSQAAAQALGDGLAAFTTDQATQARMKAGARELGVPGA